MNEQTNQNELNPFAEFDAAFDILPLPSKGMFYADVDGKKVDTAKVYHLTAEDESIMTSTNLIKSGNLLDVLLQKKVKCAIPVNKLLVGDRLAILIYLRATMEQIYKVELTDPETDKPFIHSVDLATLQMGEINELPTQDGLYDFHLKRAKRRVTFRLMTGEDENIIRMRQKSESELRKSDTSMYTVFKMEQTVVSVEGINDMLTKSHFLKNMPLMDSRELLKYMNSVNPSIDLEFEVKAPSGSRFRQILPFTAEFFYPTL